MSAPTLRVGLSTCPNDTFAFHGLLTGEVVAQGLRLEFELADIEELNRRFAAGALDVAKVSFHAALRMAERLIVLPVGAALGFGVGPVLLAAAGREQPADAIPTASGARRARVLAPGESTTATLLYRLFHPGEGELRQTVFHAIFDALESGEADFGVCIHEGRFTYAARGLRLIEDLGESWERRTGSPLPLGGLVARRSLGAAHAARVARAVRASLERSLADPARALPTMRAHAREHSDDVLMQHVELYVNRWTLDLGAEGRRALARLAAESRAAGALPPEAPDLEVLDLEHPSAEEAEAVRGEARDDSGGDLDARAGGAAAKG